MRRSKRIVKRTLAFAKRELKLTTRYKFSFISNIIISPILRALPLILLYWGIIGATSGGFEDVTQENFLSWILLGIVAHQIFFSGNSYFRGRFIQEKFWMTIYGTLIAPISKYYFLFGVVIQLSLQGFLTASVFILLSYIAFPTTILSFFLVLIILFATIITGAAIGLIAGTFYLVNENIVPVFDYVLFASAFLSTYAIPYEVYPSFLQPLVDLNPLYHLIKLSRYIWEENYYFELIWSVVFVLLFMAICIIFGVYLFSKVTRRFGVRGY